MKSRNAKFVIGVGIILTVVVWQAVTGFEQSKTYYVTVEELLTQENLERRLRVAGLVAEDSIHRQAGVVTFRLMQDDESVPVTYVGTDALPDTFTDGAQAIVDGSYGEDGVFRADRIQAKCTSKYEPKYEMPASPDTSDSPFAGGKQP